MSGNVTLTIDGKEIIADKGDTILNAALKNGIYIPHLCYHPDLEPFGGCRVCMVEVQGKGLTISCKTPATEGMVVISESPDINQLRRNAIELLIVNHPVDCLSCTRNTDCRLQDIANYVGIDEGHLKQLKRVTKEINIDDSNPFFLRDLNKCVLCGICVRTCKDILGVSAIDFAYRGSDTKISTLEDKGIMESRCVSCGECVARCPVGALVPKDKVNSAYEVKSVCAYCGCGCGIYIGVRNNKIVSIRGDKENPANHGRLCVKGRFGYHYIDHPERLTTPLVRKNGNLEEATWDEALDLVADKLSQYQGNELAVISSAKCTNETNYLVQKLARSVLKTNNVDHCARL
jgi:formate dehydrogenase major subunit